MDFISTRPGFAVHPVLAKELPMAAFYARLQEEGISKEEKVNLKKLLKAHLYVPVGVFFPEMEVRGDEVIVFPKTVYQFRCKLSKLHLKQPVILNHPEKYISLALTEHQIKALRAYRKRYNLLYK